MANQTHQTKTDPKVIGIVSYLTIIGWIVAIVLNNPKKDLASFHIRQSLGIILMGVVASIIPVLNIVLWIIPLIAWIIGFIGALQGEKKLVPYVGEYFQDWFNSL